MRTRNLAQTTSGFRVRAEGARPGMTESPRRLLAFDEGDLDAFFHRLREPHHVPVGEPDAAVRVAFADMGRLAGAVNAVAFLRQRDPRSEERRVGKECRSWWGADH